MARASMTALIARVRTLINDPSGSSQIFTDDQIQDVMDESREDIVNQRLIPTETYNTGTTVQYLNFYSSVGGWETDYVLKQYMTTTVTPSSVEPIAGKFTFAASTVPNVYITGKIFDVYRAAADLLERRAAKVAADYDVVVGGQKFDRSQAADAFQKLAKTYRQKQRPRTSTLTRSDLNTRQTNDVTGPRWPRDWGYF